MAALHAKVLLFVASLDVAGERLRALESLLSPDERTRSASMRIERVRRRFIAGRGLVREALAQETGMDPRRLELRIGPRGKPSLEEPRAAPRIEFNVSHSEDILIVAVARGRAVGVDVEVERPDVDVEGLAARFFSLHEREALLALDAAARVRAFFACWTRKEAYIKARGEGMAIPLDRFEVALAPGEPPALLADRGDPRAPREWTLVDLSASAGAPAAMAVDTRDGGTFTVSMRRPGTR